MLAGPVSLVFRIDIRHVDRDAAIAPRGEFLPLRGIAKFLLDGLLLFVEYSTLTSGRIDCGSTSRINCPTRISYSVDKVVNEISCRASAPRTPRTVTMAFEPSRTRILAFCPAELRMVKQITSSGGASSVIPGDVIPGAKRISVPAEAACTPSATTQVKKAQNAIQGLMVYSCSAGKSGASQIRRLFASD